MLFPVRSVAVRLARIPSRQVPASRSPRARAATAASSSPEEPDDPEIVCIVHVEPEDVGRARLRERESPIVERQGLRSTRLHVVG